jgi:hypothetical protein
MILSKTFTTATKLTTFLRGSYVASGSDLDGAAAGPDVDSGGSDSFSAASEGDYLYVNGDGLFLIVTKTDDDNLILDANLTLTHSNSDWIVTQNAIDAANIISISETNGKFLLVWDSLTFDAAQVAILSS